MWKTKIDKNFYFLRHFEIQLRNLCHLGSRILPAKLFVFFNDTATTEIYTLSLHDALPILTNQFACMIELLQWMAFVNTNKLRYREITALWLATLLEVYLWLPTSREKMADQNSNEPRFAIISEDFIDSLICTSFLTD